MGLIRGNLDANLFQATLNARNNFEMVYNRSFGYNVLSTISSMLNVSNGGGFRIDTVDGKYEYAWDDRNEVITQIASSAANTANPNFLDIVFVDPTYEFFRLKDYVMDSSQNKGRVIASVPGSITIEPTGYTFPAANTTMFLNNTYVKVIGDLSGVRDSSGKSSLYSIPNLDYNYCQVTRDSVGLSRKDKVATYVMNGKEYWYSKQESDMIDRIGRADERILLFGDRFQYTSPNEGLINGNGGLDWSIKNRGGLYYGLNSPLTRLAFQNILAEHAVRSAQQGQTITLAMGTQALNFLQENFTSDFIRQTGSRNTFGGEKVRGLNVMEYAIGGNFYDILILPALNDAKFYPETSAIPGINGTLMSNRIYILDLNPIPVVGNDSKRLPAVQRIYWGEDEKLYRVIPGMVGKNGNSTGGSNVGRYQTTTSPKDGYQCEFLQDMGWNIALADRMALIEYIR